MQNIKQVKKDFSTLWHFYGLAAHYTKHWTSHERFFYPLTLLRLGFLHSTPSWMVTIEMDWLHHRPCLGFDLLVL